MALSKEVLDQIAYAEKMGYTKLNQFPPAQTRELMKQAPANPNPTPVGEVINTVIPRPAISPIPGSSVIQSTPDPSTPDPSIPVRIYIPAGTGPFPVIAYFHGGGFTLMSLDTHDEICRQLCLQSSCVVMSVDYRLAPEHPSPRGPKTASPPPNG